MKIILSIFLTLVFGSMTLIAQDSNKDQTETIELLRNRLKQIEQEEKTALRKQVENINSLLDNGVVGDEEANRLKLKAAKSRAEIIEKRQASVLETIAFLEKKEKTNTTQPGDYPIFLDIDTYFEENRNNDELKKSSVTPLRLEEPQPVVQDFRNTEIRNPTTLDLIFATGLNNVTGEGISISDITDDTNFSFSSSRFFEIGFALKTPLVKQNQIRIKYGVSFQSNELELRDNGFFTEVDSQTIIQEFPTRLNETRFVVKNLVVPVHLEFGPTKKKYNSKGGYYSASNKFKIGLGGYIGVNLNARQELISTVVLRGRPFRSADISDDFDVNNEIYGLSAYIGFGAFSLYGKYDLNTIFRNDILNQQFVSAGLRIDL